MKNEKELTSFWQIQVESAVHCLTEVRDSIRTKSKILTKKAETILRGSRSIIPYCLHPAGHDGSCILLNRDYLPLGNTKPGSVDYAHYKWAHTPPIPNGRPSNSGRIYFFGDRFAAWNSRVGLCSAPWDSRVGLDGLIERLHEFLSEDWPQKGSEDDFLKKG